MDLSNYYGMDLRNLDVTTPEQAEGLRRYYRDAKDAVMPEYEFWLEHRPDVAKRRILFNMLCRSDEARRFMLPSLMGWIAYYTLIGYADGIVYQIVNAQKVGAPRELIIDAFSVAQLFANETGLRVVEESGADAYLATYVDPAPGQIFPDDWSYDPAAFAAGLDPLTPDLTAADAQALTDWYRRTLGEIPDWVTLSIEARPRELKAYRRRWEQALLVAPKQVMPYLLIHLNLLFEREAGVREAFLLARAFGMTREQLLDGIGRMVSYGGMGAVSLAVATADDVFDSYG